MTYSIILLIVYFIVLVVITYYSRINKSFSTFAIGDRKIGIVGTVASLVSGFRDGAGLAVWISLAIFFGFGALWLTIGLSLGLLMLSIHANTIRTNAEKEDYVTVGDMISSKIGKNTSLVSSLLIAGTALLYSASQLFVSGRIFSELFSLDVNLGIILTAIIIGAYLFIGGYNTVVKTDILQWGIIMAILVLPFMIGNPSNVSLNFFSSFISPGLQNAIGFAGISFLVVYSSADVWQRIYSANSSKTAKNGLLLTIPIYFAISIGLIAFGIIMKAATGNVPAGEAFFAIFSLSSVSPIVIAVVGVFSIASVMSTLDTQVFLFASTVARNLTKSNLNKNDQYKKFVNVSRLTIIILMSFLVMIAFTIADIIQFLFSAVTLGTILLPILFFATLSKADMKKNIDTIFSICLLIATIVYVFMFYKGYFSNILLTLVPASVSVILCLATYKIVNKTERLN